MAPRTPAQQGPRVTTVRPGFGGPVVQSSTMTATPLRPFVGPVATTTTAGPYGAVRSQSAMVATPLRPFVGPVQVNRVGFVGH